MVPLRSASVICLFLTVNYVYSQTIDDTIKDIFKQPGTETRNPVPINTNPVPGTGDCKCVPYYLCNNNQIITTGETLIDIR